MLTALTGKLGRSARYRFAKRYINPPVIGNLQCQGVCTDRTRPCPHASRVDPIYLPLRRGWASRPDMRKAVVRSADYDDIQFVSRRRWASYAHQAIELHFVVLTTLAILLSPSPTSLGTWPTTLSCSSVTVGLRRRSHFLFFALSGFVPRTRGIHRCLWQYAPLTCSSCAWMTS